MPLVRTPRSLPSPRRRAGRALRVSGIQSYGDVPRNSSRGSSRRSFFFFSFFSSFLRSLLRPLPASTSSRVMWGGRSRFGRSPRDLITLRPSPSGLLGSAPSSDPLAASLAAGSPSPSSFIRSRYLSPALSGVRPSACRPTRDGSHWPGIDIVAEPLIGMTTLAMALAATSPSGAGSAVLELYRESAAAARRSRRDLVALLPMPRDSPGAVRYTARRASIVVAVV